MLNTSRSLLVRVAVIPSIRSNALSLSRSLSRSLSTSTPFSFDSQSKRKQHQYNTHQQQLRSFSSTGSSDEEKAQDSGVLGKIISPKNQTYVFLGGSVLGTLGIAKIAMNFTSFFTHLTPQLVGKWGFYTGFGT